MKPQEIIEGAEMYNRIMEALKECKKANKASNYNGDLLWVMCNGKCIALCHNHPSGNMQPSEPDKRMTRLFCEGAKMINMRLIDHIILSPEGDYFSFNENGMI